MPGAGTRQSHVSESRSTRLQAEPSSSEPWADFLVIESASDFPLTKPGTRKYANGERTVSTNRTATTTPAALPHQGAESVRPGGPELSLLLLLLLLRGPDLLARLGLLQRDRVRLLGDQLQGAAHPQILLEKLLAAGLADLLQGVGRFRVSVILVTRRNLEGLEHVLLTHLDALGLRNGLQDRLALQRLLGLGARLLDHLLASFSLDLQVILGVHSLLLELALDSAPHL